MNKKISLVALVLSCAFPWLAAWSAQPPMMLEGKDEFTASLNLQAPKVSEKELRAMASDNYQEKADRHFMSLHAQKGVSCTDCHAHNPMGVLWMGPVTNPPMKRECADCHAVQGAVRKHADTHDALPCAACHLPNVLTAKDYSNDQKEAQGAVRRLHSYKIEVSPDKTSMVQVPAEKDGKKALVWVPAKNEDGRGFVDLMWSCARNAPMDYTVFEGRGCHSEYTSKLDEGLVWKDQKQVYDETIRWQEPVKEAFKRADGAVKRINKLLEVTKLTPEARTQAMVYLDQAQEILDMIEKDGSWGAHASTYLKQRAATALTFADKAQAILDQAGFQKTAK